MLLLSLLLMLLTILTSGFVRVQIVRVFTLPVTVFVCR